MCVLEDDHKAICFIKAEFFMCHNMLLLNVFAYELSQAFMLKYYDGGS